MELKLIKDDEMLLMLKKCIRGQILYLIQTYAKANDKHMKNYVRSTELSYLMYRDARNLYELAMLKNFLHVVLSGKKEKPRLIQKFI